MNDERVKLFLKKGQKGNQKNIETKREKLGIKTLARLNQRL